MSSTNERHTQRKQARTAEAAARTAEAAADRELRKEQHAEVMEALKGGFEQHAELMETLDADQMEAREESKAQHAELMQALREMAQRSQDQAQRSQEQAQQSREEMQQHFYDLRNYLEADAEMRSRASVDDDVRKALAKVRREAWKCVKLRLHWMVAGVMPGDMDKESIQAALGERVAVSAPIYTMLSSLVGLDARKFQSANGAYAEDLSVLQRFTIMANALVTIAKSTADNAVGKKEHKGCVARVTSLRDAMAAGVYIVGEMDGKFGLAMEDPVQKVAVFDAIKNDLRDWSDVLLNQRRALPVSYKGTPPTSFRAFALLPVPRWKALTALSNSHSLYVTQDKLRKAKDARSKGRRRKKTGEDGSVDKRNTMPCHMYAKGSCPRKNCPFQHAKPGAKRAASSADGGGDTLEAEEPPTKKMKKRALLKTAKLLKK